jgi:allophanate hydrolase subunit 1
MAANLNVPTRRDLLVDTELRPRHGCPVKAIRISASRRTKVPASSVGFASEFSGIYPRESPGGWPPIGQTDAVVWDVHRPDPALLTLRKWVQFWEAR